MSNQMTARIAHPTDGKELSNGCTRRSTTHSNTGTSRASKASAAPSTVAITTDPTTRAALSAVA